MFLAIKLSWEWVISVFRVSRRLPQLAGAIGTKGSFGVFENSQQQTRLPQVKKDFI
jgi:hypothetical protein